MSVFLRTSRYCAELDRLPEELIALAQCPGKLSLERFATHRRDTTTLYVQVCAAFARFCVEHERPVLVRSADRAGALILDFLQSMREKEGWGAYRILPAIAAIRTWYYTRDLPRPQSRALSAYCLSVRKEWRRRPATPVDPDQVKAMCRMALSTRRPIVALRDRALLLYAFLSAVRPSELVRLRVEHITFAPGGAGFTVLLPESKGDPLNQGQFVTVAHAWDPLYCPVRSLRAWLDESNITSGIVFRSIDRHGNIGPDDALTGQAYRDILRPYLKAPGLPGKWAGYSMRRGYATSAHDFGASEDEIQRQLRHKQRSTTRLYIDQRPIPFERSITGVLLS
jgi:integrase